MDVKRDRTVLSVIVVSTGELLITLDKSIYCIFSYCIVDWHMTLKSQESSPSKYVYADRKGLAKKGRFDLLLKNVHTTHSRRRIHT